LREELWCFRHTFEVVLAAHQFELAGATVVADQSQAWAAAWCGRAPRALSSSPLLATLHPMSEKKEAEHPTLLPLSLSPILSLTRSPSLSTLFLGLARHAGRARAKRRSRCFATALL
jgi:hypothetical protein